MTFEELENLIKPLKDINNKLSSVKIRIRKDIVEILNTCDLLIEFKTLNEKFWAIKNKIIKRPVCECGNKSSFNYVNNTFRIYCSTKCIANINNRKIKSKEKLKNLYGVENISQVQHIKDLKKKKSIEKYGVNCVLQSSKIKEKIKKTNLEKYGVEYIGQSNEIIKKRIISKRQNFIKNKLILFFNILEQDFKIIPYNWKKEEYIKVNYLYNFKHLVCNRIFKGNFDNGLLPKCPTCHTLKSGVSQIELKLRDDLISILGQEKLDYSNRELINPYELDIIIDNKLAIEVNGSYWHRDESNGISLLEKSNLSLISILHFWDFELEQKYEICKSIILSKLQIFDEVIYARKCEYKTVNSKEARQFFERYHLQGSSNSKYNYGLYYKNELVLCIGISKPRFNKNYDLEIHRIASKLNTKIIGGISKLFKRIKQDFQKESIITYADKRYSNGDIYKFLGFKELNDSRPNYFYRKNNSILTRYQTQKHKLNKLLKHFDNKLTEKENMQLNNYHKFYDCGNKVFTI